MAYGIFGRWPSPVWCCGLLLFQTSSRENPILSVVLLRYRQTFAHTWMNWATCNPSIRISMPNGRPFKTRVRLLCVNFFSFSWIVSRRRGRKMLSRAVSLVPWVLITAKCTQPLEWMATVRLVSIFHAGKRPVMDKTLIPSQLIQCGPYVIVISTVYLIFGLPFSYGLQVRQCCW